MTPSRETRALVLGASGLVGHYCWRAWRRRPGWSAIGASHRLRLPGLETIDIRDAASTRGLLRATKPSLVVLAAANPFVDYCEEHPEETRAVNVDATLEVAAACRELGATLVFFSSDYVFDGAAAPYGEADPVCPLNRYGRQKVEAERGLARIGTDHLVLRVSGVFGWELSRKNFVLQAIDRARAGRVVRAATDIRGNPTYAANLPGVIAELYEDGRRGLYHAAGAEEWTRYDLAREVARAFGLEGSALEATTLAELRAAAPRPRRSSLRTDKIRGQTRAPLWGAAAALAHMRGEEAAWSAYVVGLGLAT